MASQRPSAEAATALTSTPATATVVVDENAGTRALRTSVVGPWSESENDAQADAEATGRDVGVQAAATAAKAVGRSEADVARVHDVLGAGASRAHTSSTSEATSIAERSSAERDKTVPTVVALGTGVALALIAMLALPARLALLAASTTLNDGGLTTITSS